MSQPFNKYPFGDFVSYFYHAVSYLPESKEQRIAIDAGCGSGNNSWFMAELGFQVFGFDIDQEQISRARILAEHRKVKENCKFNIGSLEHWPFDELTHKCDLVVDRGSFCKVAHVDDCFFSAYEYLKPGGVLISFLYGADTELKEEVTKLTLDEVVECAQDFEIIQIDYLKSKSLVRRNCRKRNYEQYVVIAQKPQEDCCGGEKEKEGLS